MEKIKLLVPILFSLFVFEIQAQITFKKVYGGSDQDYAYSGLQTLDSGYVMAGTTSSFNLINKNIYVVKTDKKGFIQWTKVFYTGLKGLSIKQTLDSGYVVAGFSEGFANDYDMNLIRIDKTGNFLWWKTYGGNDWDFGNSIQITTDGGFILAGGTYSYGAGNEDFYLVKTNANGDTLWTKTYGSSAEEEAKSVKQTSDGGYILIGSTKKNNAVSKSDIWCVKTNANGDTLWTKTYSRSDNDYGNDIIQTSDGGYAIGSTSYNVANSKNQAYIIKTDANGIVQNTSEWANVWVGPNLVYYDTYCNGIIQDDLGRLIFIGQERTGGTLEMIIFKIKTDGSYVNSTTYGTSTGDENAFFVQQTYDKGFVLGGITNGTGYGMNDMLLVKVDSNLALPGAIFVGINEQTNNQNNLLTLFPNPASNNLKISFPTSSEINDNALIEVFSIYGNKIMSEQKNNDNTATQKTFESNLNTQNLASGIYLIKITTNNSILSQKLIIQH